LRNFYRVLKKRTIVKSVSEAHPRGLNQPNNKQKRMEIKNLPSRITVVLLAFLISAFSTLAQAQSKRITGNVVDESDFPLPGVSILIKGTGSGTITDLDGDYSLEVPDENAVLAFLM
jgi:hypothetical protein